MHLFHHIKKKLKKKKIFLAKNAKRKNIINLIFFLGLKKFKMKRLTWKASPTNQSDFCVINEQICVLKLCCAPQNSKNETRCHNQTVHKNSDHCCEHQPYANILYGKYKEICEIAKSKNIDCKIKDQTEHVKYLMHCYNWFANAYDARLKHRKYAYVPETYDFGHDVQFEILQQDMLLCEAKIRKTIQSQNKEVTKQDHHQYKNEDEVVSQVSLQSIDRKEEKNQNDKHLKRIAHFKAQKNREDLKFNKVLQKNIKENELIMHNRTKVATLLVKLLNGLDVKIDNNSFLQLATLYIIIELHNNLYFKEYYEPPPCPNCACGGFKNVNFVLGCYCLFKNNDDMVQHFAQSSFELTIMKRLIDDILKNQDKIKPIAKDFLQCYQYFGMKLVCKVMTLSWDEESNRLLFIYDGCYVKSKRSDDMKRFRVTYGPTCKKIQVPQKPILNYNWFSVLQELCHYIDYNGKLPSENSKQEKTQFLHDWLYEQRLNWSHDDLDNVYLSAFLKFLDKYQFFFFNLI